MFRKMRRFKQQLENTECSEILAKQWRGVLAVHGDDDYPYALPLNFYYDEAAGVIYFHGAREGHKIDSIRKEPKASFCVINDGAYEDGDWSRRFKSVIVFGKMYEVTDQQEHDDAILKLGRKYYPTEEELKSEIERDGARAYMLALKIEYMTGKKVHEK